MSEFPGVDLTEAELRTRLGPMPDDRLAREGARVTGIYRAMRAERNECGSRYDFALLDGWFGSARRRMINGDRAGQLQEILRLERQMDDLRSGAYVERLEKQQRATAQAEAERAVAARPAMLLATLRAAGKYLALDEQGRITVPPGTDLHMNEIAAVREHREALVGLLQAEAAAAAPLVIA